MHTRTSNKVLKTSKLWSLTPPSNLKGKDVENFYKEHQDYKRTMLGIVVKEAKYTGKENNND